MHLRQRNGQGAPGPGHGLISIGTEVHYNLVDLDRVGKYTLFGVDLVHDFNGGGNGWSE